MPQSTQTHFNAVDPLITLHYGLERQRHTAEYTQIFKKSKGREAVKYANEHGGPSQLALKTENQAMSEADIVEGPRKSWFYAVYARQITVSYELAKDSRYEALQSCAESLGRAVELTPEYLTAAYLDDAFNSAGSALMADGVELCATNHLIVGTNASNGQNELNPAAALTDTSLEDVMTNLLDQVGPDGMKIRINPKMLIVPSALKNTADKLSMTEYEIGTANNDISVVKTSRSGIKPFCFRFLGSSTRWFVQTDAPNGAFCEYDEEGEYLTDQMVNMLQKLYAAFIRLRYGVVDWRQFYGSASTI